ncbi:MAG: family 78 glycoside hydrolase catalytic domain [Phycisphaeraceae bacterium]|nr:family 78 glycoside hydrolase catalytic domain [Phycisphaeraceae bacterium]
MQTTLYTRAALVGRALIVAVLLLSTAHARGARTEPGTLRATHLRCEYLTDPLGVAEKSPRLSWVVESDRRAERQTAYRVLVASSPEVLARNEGDLWDSDKIESDQTSQIEYAGRPLRSRERCWWKVLAWDKDGNPGGWSTPGTWAMGLLSPADWHAAWIDAGPDEAGVRITRAVYHTIDGHAGERVERDVTENVLARYATEGASMRATNEALGGDPARNVRKSLRVEYTCDGEARVATIAENARVILPGAPLPLLRKGFEIEGKITDARLYITALGVYEAFINGERVGDMYLAPGWTDYRRRVRYQVFDVAHMLESGSNAISAEVGPGWFAGHAGLFGAYQFYGSSPALLAQLEITFADGRVERIVTDETWKRYAGPRLMADLLKGEWFDARRERAGWKEPGFDDRAWAAAATREESRNLEPQVSEPVRNIETLPALSVAEPAPGAFVFDLGQNMVGVVRLRLTQPAGTRLTIRHGEMINPDGTLYTANLRAADSIDVYTCAGTPGGETFQPAFTFHGFRYVEITGLAPGTRPESSMVTGIVLSSDMPVAGAFECSDERLNKLQQNIVWGMRGNYIDIPTDCPQRDERMGWMADTQVFVPTAAMNADVAGFFTKWMVDVIDAQRDDGAHSDVAPVMLGLSYGTPAWGDAGVIVPWLIHEAYNDRRILERSIDSMMAWVAWCEKNSTNLIRDKARGNDYGDWLSIDAETPKDLIGTAYFAHAADLTARALRVLGRNAEAEGHEDLFRRIRAAFNEKYVASDGTIRGQTQSACALAIAFGLLDENGTSLTAQLLVADIERRGNRITTGFVGVSQSASHVLTAIGRDDGPIASRCRTPHPGFLREARATTIWERWNGGRRDRAAPGYLDELIQPLRSARAAHGCSNEWLDRTRSLSRWARAARDRARDPRGHSGGNRVDTREPSIDARGDRVRVAESRRWMGDGRDHSGKHHRRGPRGPRPGRDRGASRGRRRHRCYRVRPPDARRSRARGAGGRLRLILVRCRAATRGGLRPLERLKFRRSVPSVGETSRARRPKQAYPQ